MFIFFGRVKNTQLQSWLLFIFRNSTGWKTFFKNLKPQKSSCLMFSVAQSQCLILTRETYIILQVSKNKVIFAHSSAVYDLDVSSGGCLLRYCNTNRKMQCRVHHDISTIAYELWSQKIWNANFSQTIEWNFWCESKCGLMQSSTSYDGLLTGHFHIISLGDQQFLVRVKFGVCFR